MVRKNVVFRVLLLFFIERVERGAHLLKNKRQCFALIFDRQLLSNRLFFQNIQIKCTVKQFNQLFFWHFKRFFPWNTPKQLFKVQHHGIRVKNKREKCGHKGFLQNIQLLILLMNIEKKESLLLGSQFIIREHEDLFRPFFSIFIVRNIIHNLNYLPFPRKDGVLFLYRFFLLSLHI